MAGVLAGNATARGAPSRARLVRGGGREEGRRWRSVGDKEGRRIRPAWYGGHASAC